MNSTKVLVGRATQFEAYHYRIEYVNSWIMLKQLNNITYILGSIESLVLVC